MVEKKLNLDVLKDEMLLEVKDVAEFLQVSSRTVLRMIDQRTLRAFKVGDRWRIRPKDLEEYIQTHFHNEDVNSESVVKGTRSSPTTNEIPKEFADLKILSENEENVSDQRALTGSREE